MKRTFVKYFILLVLLTTRLNTIAQTEQHYHSGKIALEQSKLFPSKFIHLRNKYYFNQKLLKEKATCLILTEKNDKEINLQLQEVKRNRKTRNVAYLIGVPAAIVGIAFIYSGVKYISDHDNYNVFTGTGTPITSKDLAYGRKLEQIGLGISVVSATALIVGATYSIKSRRATRSAVKIYNQKY